jgi:hypothetical protein
MAGGHTFGEDRIKWGLGGEPAASPLSEEHVKKLHWLVDVLVPPENGFPAPSSTTLVEDFFPRYVSRDVDDLSTSRSPVRFPGISRAGLARLLDAVSVDALSQSGQEAEALVRGVAEDFPEEFAGLLALTYYGYYSRPQVVEHLRRALPGGKYYQLSPQPYGYAEIMEDWPSDMLPPPERAHYTP